MLSKAEQEIVDSNKVLQFGAYLQAAYIDNCWLKKKILNGKYPERETLRYLERMNYYRIDFNECYLHSLPLEKLNPLKAEQEAWKLLSPKVKKHVDEFGDFIEEYSPQNADKERLLALVNADWSLLKKWNVISNSYKAKQQKWADIEIEKKEQVVKRLAQKLQSMSP